MKEHPEFSVRRAFTENGKPQTAIGLSKGNLKPPATPARWQRDGSAKKRGYQYN
jgi:hypothetical protein